MNRSVDDDAVTGAIGPSDDEAFSALPIPAKGSLLLGKYRVEGVVGVGGMGMVIAARHEHLNERVALKMLLPTYAQLAETRKRFQREAQAAYKLQSEHVCRVLDAGDLEDGTPFIAMEFLKGDDLAVLLRKKLRFAVAEAVDFILQACEALGEAHANDIVHRDLKPANLVVITRKDGTPCLKVIDFGISKVSSEASSLTNTFGYLGSPSYSAPEQFASTRAMTASGDIWSLGVILYEMVAGKRPFDFPGESLAEMATTITYAAAIPITQRDPSIDPAFERVVMKCLEKEPADRHARVRDLAEALVPFASAVPDELLARLRRHQPGRGESRSGSTPHRTADVPGPVLSSSTVPMANAPLPSARPSSPNAQASEPSLPRLSVPSGNTRYAIAADPPARTSGRSVWIPLTLAGLGCVAGLAAVAAYRGAHPTLPSVVSTPTGSMIATGSGTSDPGVLGVVGTAQPSAIAVGAPSVTPVLVAVAAPSASAASSAPAVPTTRGTASGRGAARHGPVPAPTESGPKILRDRDGKF